jgi:two-component system nitrate/nitrite response regulator NarL
LSLTMPAPIPRASRSPRARDARSAGVRPRGHAIRIVLAGDHALVRAGIRRLLEDEPDCIVLGEVATAHDAVATTLALRPDLIVLDVSGSSQSAFETLKVLRDASGVRVLLLTSEIEKRDLMSALEFGARGVLLKDAAKKMLLKSIRTVMRGQYWISRDMIDELVRRATLRAPGSADPVPPGAFGLTRRESEIVQAVANGCSNRAIAAKLGVSHDTVKHHLTNIFNKTGMGNRLELALFARDRGLATND